MRPYAHVHTSFHTHAPADADTMVEAATEVVLAKLIKGLCLTRWRLNIRAIHEREVREMCGCVRVHARVRSWDGCNADLFSWTVCSVNLFELQVMDLSDGTDLTRRVPDMRARMRAHARVCVRVSALLCACVRVSVRVRVSVHICVRVHICARVRARERERAGWRRACANTVLGWTFAARGATWVAVICKQPN